MAILPNGWPFHVIVSPVPKEMTASTVRSHGTYKMKKFSKTPVEGAKQLTGTSIRDLSLECRSLVIMRGQIRSDIRGDWQKPTYQMIGASGQRRGI